MERTRLSPGYEISRVIRGGWQLAGGHGAVDRTTAIEDLIAFADAGITTFDCADIYTGVEELLGAFRTEYLNRRGAEALKKVRVHTKFVPDLQALGTMARADVETAIDRSLKRLGTERIDLVQFHWWDYSAPGCIETAGWLAEFRQAGKIAEIGGTNFDTRHLRMLTAGGVPLVSMQVQYSLLDRRPAREMVKVAEARGVSLLCYGTVAGGFLSDRWLSKPEPNGTLENRSLTKYKLIIDEFGGWDLFQALLRTLRNIADRHGTDIATVASRYILGLPQVAAVIVGARNRDHLQENLAITSITLSPRDIAELDAVLTQSRPVSGDVFELERDRAGPHGAIMKYNLNKGAA
jgi:aryl-alcohol dehydrogenase-like predicted oxidoreductase